MYKHMVRGARRDDKLAFKKKKTIRKNRRFINQCENTFSQEIE